MKAKNDKKKATLQNIVCDAPPPKSWVEKGKKQAKGEKKSTKK